MFTKIKIAWDYFMYHPDKTQVVIQVYFLNPLFKFIETVIFFIVATTRQVVLWVQEKAYKI